MALSVYKSPAPEKTSLANEISPPHIFDTEDIEYKETSDLIDIINELLAESITEKELEVLEYRLRIFPQNLIPNNVPQTIISKIVSNFQNTTNPLEEKCLILVIECFSIIEHYDPIFNELDLFHIIINKVSNSSPDSFQNVFLMLKVLANIFNSLENKEDSLNIICSLFTQFFEYENYQIFDNLIQFLYNYSNNKNSTELGCKLISNTLFSLLQKCEEKNMDLSLFSIERIFWTLKALASNFEHDFKTIFDLQIIQNKNFYLYNSTYEVTIAYISLTGFLFTQGQNPFDIHILDFIPFLKSKDKRIISPIIWIMTIMVIYSQEMADELNGINLTLFEKVYSDVDFNAKFEIAFLYLHLIDKISLDKCFDFFIENSTMLFQFLELENQEILSHMINFISRLQASLVEEGIDAKIDAFVNVALSNGFRDFLDDLIEEGILTFSN